MAIGGALLVVGLLLVAFVFGSGLRNPVEAPATDPDPSDSVSARPSASPSRDVTAATPTVAPTPSPAPSPSAPASAPPSDGPAPTRRPRIHVVESGESLTSIARRYGVTVEAIKGANVIADPNVIYAGQELVIPAT